MDHVGTMLGICGAYVDHVRLLGAVFGQYSSHVERMLNHKQRVPLKPLSIAQHEHVAFVDHVGGTMLGVFGAYVESCLTMLGSWRLCSANIQAGSSSWSAKNGTFCLRTPSLNLLRAGNLLW